MDFTSTFPELLVFNAKAYAVRSVLMKLEHNADAVVAFNLLMHHLVFTPRHL